MNKYQTSRFKMLSNTLAVFNSNTSSIWSIIVIVVTLLKDLTFISDSIKTASAKKGTKSTGATTDKNTTLEQLKENGFIASVALKLVAKTKKDTKLETDATFTKTDFGLGGEQAVIDRSTWVLAQSRLLEKDPVAADCGLTPDKNNELDALLKVLTNKETTQSTTITTKIKTTSDLSRYFKQLTPKLKDLDQAMLVNTAQSNPDFYQTYLIARRITDPATKPKNPPTPTTPTT